MLHTKDSFYRSQMKHFESDSVTTTKWYVDKQKKSGIILITPRTLETRRICYERTIYIWFTWNVFAVLIVLILMPVTTAVAQIHAT